MPNVDDVVDMVGDDAKDLLAELKEAKLSSNRPQSYLVLAGKVVLEVEKIGKAVKEAGLSKMDFAVELLGRHTNIPLLPEFMERAFFRMLLEVAVQTMNHQR